MVRSLRVLVVTALAAAVVAIGQTPAFANVAPEAFDGSTQGDLNQPVSVFLDAFDDDGDTLTFAVVTPPAHGDLDSCADGECTFTPDTDFLGSDSFTFKANDGTTDSNIATFELSIADPNAPTAYDNFVEAGADATTPLTITGSGAPDVPLTFAIVDPPTHGTLGTIGTPSCEGGFCELTIDYTTGGGYHGADSFTFTVSDGTSTSLPATIDIDVVTTPCQGAIVDNGTVKLGVNCTGELNVDEVGLRYVPTNNDSTAPGCACEGWGAADETSGVTGFANQSSGTSDNLNVVSFTHDADSATSVVDVGSTFRVTHDYQPSLDTPNAYEVTVSVKNTGTNPAHLRYRRVMDWDIEPTAFNEFVTVQKGTASEIVYTSDDGFATADALAGPSQILATGNFTDSGPDDHGALFDFDFGTLAAGATKTFKTFYGAAATEAGAEAALSAVGAEAYSLGEPSTTDGPTLGTPNTFLFAFGSVGGTPIFAPDAVDDALTTAQDTANSVNVLTNDTDPDGDPLTVTGQTNGAHGTASCTAPGVCTYTPTAGYTGPDSFTYTISDGNGGTDTATVNVTVTPAVANNPPVAVDDLTTTPEDTAKTVSVLTNDSDPDSGDTFTVTAKTNGTHGTVVCTTTTCTYTPAANYNGADSFTYTITDSHGATDTATVNVTVTAVNDAPDAVNDSATTAEDTASAAITVLANDTDVEGNSLMITGKTDGAHGTVVCGPSTCVYTPAADYNGLDSFTYTITDGNGGTDTATVNVTVTPVNDAPTAVDDTANAVTATPTGINVRVNDTDVDGDALTITSASPAAAHGTVSCTTTSCTYTSNGGYTGSDGFDYTISDGHGGVDTGHVTITVSAAPPSDVSVTKTPLQPTVAVGDLTGWTITVHNSGTAASAPVLLNDPLSSSFRYQGSTSPLCAVLAATFGCNLGSIPAGGTVTVTVRGAFVRAGNIANTATISAAGDSSAANNTSTAHTTVTGADCTIIGTFGDDVLIGTKGNDVICGLGGDDRLIGKKGNDTLYGGDGNDRLMGLGGNDLIDGGPGIDRAQFSALAQSVRVNLGLHSATGQGVDTLVSIENVTGSPLQDTLIGDALPNMLVGGGGGDRLIGGGGSDILRGGRGNDLLRGGSGNDQLLGGAGSDRCGQGPGTGPRRSC